MSKKKKEKVIWYDDNSTVSDMSNVGRNGKTTTPSSSKSSNFRTVKQRSTFKDKWNTYWQTVKLMIMPTLVALAIIGILYLIVLGISNAAM